MSVFHGHPFFDFALHDSIKPFAFDVMMDDSPVPHAYDDGIDCMNQPEKRQESIQPKKENESGEGCFHGDEQKCTEAKRRNWTVKEGKNVSGKKTKVTVKTREKGDDKSGKGYIHVRARRGQATDSHSLAERVRREKISERMKTLQTLVPGCDKVTGKALMLDEIINYVQSLQNQVEFLSMKLASMNPTVYHFTNGSDCSELKPQSMSAPQPALQSDGFSVAVDSTAFHISNDLFDFPFVNTSDYSLLLPDHGQNLAPQMIESQSNRFIDQASFMGLFQ